MKMVEDPVFLTEINKMNPGCSFMVGDALVAGYPKGVSVTPEVVAFMKKILSEKYDVAFD